MNPRQTSTNPARSRRLRLLAKHSDEGRRPVHPRGRHSNIFLPGVPVPETGIYQVIHDRAHREAHEVVMHRGDPFPPCDQCDMRVRFRLVRTAPYIFDDEDFVDRP